MNIKINLSGILLLCAIGFNHNAFAQSSGSACDFTVTNSYNSDKPRVVYVYKGSDTLNSSSYQYADVDYGTTEEFNCGTGEENCKIRWKQGNDSGMVTEWFLEIQTVACDENYVITTINTLPE